MFRPFRLLSLAAQAEGLRWKRVTRGYAVQAGLGAAAAVFGLFLLGMLHVALYMALLRPLGPVGAALAVALVDLVALGVLGARARSRHDDAVEHEATQVRDVALRQVGDLGARAVAFAPLMRSRSLKKGLIGTAVTAVVVGFLTRR